MKNIKLLIGEDSLILNNRISKLTKEYIDSKDEFNYLTFDFETDSLDEIIDCLQSPSFSSENKVVICKNPYFIKDYKIKVAYDNNLSLIEQYLKSPNENTLWIVIIKKEYVNLKSKYYNLFAEYADIEDFDFSNKNKLSDYASSLFSLTNLKIDDDALEELVNRCDDVVKLEREVSKLILLNEEIDINIIKEFVSRPLEDDIFELSNAILSKDKNKIMHIYNDIKIQRKQEPVNIVGLLGSSFRFLLEVGILRKRKDIDIESYLKVHPYRVKLAFENLNNYSLDEIKDILIKLATLDKQIKSGEVDRFIALELFLASC